MANVQTMQPGLKRENKGKACLNLQVVIVCAMVALPQVLLPENTAVQRLPWALHVTARRKSVYMGFWVQNLNPKPYSIKRYIVTCILVVYKYYELTVMVALVMVTEVATQ